MYACMGDCQDCCAHPITDAAWWFRVAILLVCALSPTMPTNLGCPRWRNSAQGCRLLLAARLDGPWGGGGRAGVAATGVTHTGRQALCIWLDAHAPNAVQVGVHTAHHAAAPPYMWTGWLLQVVAIGSRPAGQTLHACMNASVLQEHSLLRRRLINSPY